MDGLREWSDEERARVARELRGESLVWAKVLVEHSYAAERLDPFAMVRCALGDAIDDGWSGRTIDIATYAGHGLTGRERVRHTHLVRPELGRQLEREVGGGQASLGQALRQVAGRAVGPDLILVLASNFSRLTANLAKGAVDSRFLVGTLGEEPSDELRELATQSGGTAMAVRDESDARFLGSMLCTAYLALAKAGTGRVVDPKVATQYFDATPYHHRLDWANAYRPEPAQAAPVSCMAMIAGRRDEGYGYGRRHLFDEDF